MPRFNIAERLQLACDICSSESMDSLLKRAAEAASRELATVGFEAVSEPKTTQVEVPGGYRRTVGSFLVDRAAGTPYRLRVALSMFTDGMCRGRCQLVLSLHERAADIADAEQSLGRRVGHQCAFVTPSELAFGDSPHDVEALHRVIAQRGFGPSVDWAPGLAREVAAAFCEQVSP